MVTSKLLQFLFKKIRCYRLHKKIIIFFLTKWCFTCYTVFTSEVRNLKKSVLTGLSFSIVAFVLSMITIIVSFNSISNTKRNFEASLSIITNIGVLNSSIYIMSLILGCCLFIASLILLSLTLKLMASKKDTLI